MLAASIAAALAALSVARPAVIGSEASRQALAHIHHTSSPHRRAALHAGLSLLSASLCFPPLAARAATITGDVGRKCTTASTPSATTVTCQGYGLAGGRVRSCAADEACLSTSAISNPSKFAPPWSPISAQEAADAARAWRSVAAAVAEEPGLRIVEQDDGGRYLRATGPSAVPTDGTDDVEFVLRDDGGVRLLYRSATRQSVFLYPLQQPVSNQQSHIDRLASIRRRLGGRARCGISPHISPHLEARCGISPHISPHLPTSPRISRPRCARDRPPRQTPAFQLAHTPETARTRPSLCAERHETRPPALT